MRILLINTGGSSSKLGYWVRGELASYRETSPGDEVTRLPAQAQLEARHEELLDYLDSEGIDPGELDGIACRGGLLAPLPRGGIYRVNEQMLEDLRSERYGSHASNLSAQMGKRVADQVGKEIPLVVVDPVTVDEFPSHARLSGVPGVERRSRFHALNLRHTCRKAALSLGEDLEDTSLIGVHLGTGISVIAVEMGRVVDVNDALLGEGPFTVERAGTVPLRGVLELDSRHPRDRVEEILLKESGFRGYLGTSDFREVENMLEEGDDEAQVVYQAFLHKLTKAVGGAAGVLDGRQDALVITGGMAHSDLLVKDLTHRLDWVGRTFVFPGGYEMEALGSGAERAIRGKEKVREYSGEEQSLRQITDFHSLKLEARRRESEGPVVLAGGADEGHLDFITSLSHLDPGDIILVDTPERFDELGKDRLPGDCICEPSDDPAAHAAQIALTRHVPLVKVTVSSDKLLKALLTEMKGREDGDDKPFLSHIGVLENPRTERLLLISDGGLNVDPDLDDKREILKNAVELSQLLGVEEPKVLLQAGMEDKGQDIPAINHARQLKQMWEDGEFPGCVVDGPFGVDVALSRESAEKKGIRSEVAGRADVIITPTLEAANMTIKSVLFFTASHWAGIVVGAPIPVMLVSRGDELESRLLSVSLGRLVAQRSAQAQEAQQ